MPSRRRGKGCSDFGLRLCCSSVTDRCQPAISFLKFLQDSNFLRIAQEIFGKFLYQNANSCYASLRRNVMARPDGVGRSIPSPITSLLHFICSQLRVPFTRAKTMSGRWKLWPRFVDRNLANRCSFPRLFGFSPDPRIEPEYQVNTHYWTATGYDRGHMAPIGVSRSATAEMHRSRPSCSPTSSPRHQPLTGAFGRRWRRSSATITPNDLGRSG